MSNIAADAILTAVRGVLEDGTGTLRTISSTRFDGGLYDSLPDDEKSRRALDRPVVEATITKMERSPHTYAQPGSLAIRRITVEVKIVRHLNEEHKLVDATRDDEKALAVVDADMVAQALEYPGNLTQDAGANATGLVSGRLQYVSSTVERVQLGDKQPGMIVTKHTFTGDVQITLATS